MQAPHKHISSDDNPQFKQLNKLAHSSRERRKQNQTLLDGVHLIQDCIATQQALKLLVIRAGSESTPDVQACLRQAGMLPQVILDVPLFDAISPVEHPSGILGVLDIPAPRTGTKQFGVLLEQIQDPGNLGSMLRTAAAAGVDVVYLSKGCAEAWSPKALRAGMGAQFRLAIHEHMDLMQVTAGWDALIATTIVANHTLYEIDLSGRVAFIFGNEGAGLSTELLAQATQHVRVPMPGKIESLNVAAAAAICLFERVRQSQA